ncbi:hypothetical protein [Sulfurovum sp. AR]|uniref:hypothetical protein n=1 Tax=Sulfurovum sp. AR TaxID=1165841 RepID=UPI00025C48DC|nr:hypothetical protein [Sulfurovum sp. AR]EIF50514.1 hypothetical protein SULAR_08527 [Sulfurovum sp. AR]
MKFTKMALAFLLAFATLQAEGTKLDISAPAPEVLSTYYAAKAQSTEKVESKLKANGFSILATTTPIKGATVITVTNDELKATNTWLATLNVLVNEKEVRIQNPSYFGAAYLQDKYTYGQFSGTLKSFQKALGDLYTVEDEFKLSKLPHYQFMMGMAHVEDTIEVGEGEDLETKLKENKYVAYTLKLPNGSTLVGHNLRSRTNKFLLKIDAAHNAHILPYRSMIKEGKAVMLDPKYYLAVSLPLLSMTEFMKIASAPGNIEKDIKRTYK